MRRNKPAKKFRLKLFFLTLFTLILIIFIGVALYTFKLYSNLKRTSPSNEQIGVSDTTQKELDNFSNKNNITNIALFGIDAGDTSSGRSDCIMILTVDSLHKNLKVSSIMRDSYVNIPGHGMDKINHAFAYGGSILALETINNTYGLNIDKYMATDFTTLPKIIDSLGGIEVNITSEEAPMVPGISSPGIYTLTGKQALAYTRIRYTSGNDFQRTARQRTILTSIYKKTLSTPSGEWANYLNNFLPFVETNINPSELVDLGTTISAISSNTLSEDRFPRDNYYQGKNIDGVYYLTFDIPTTKEQIRNFIFN